MCLTVSNVSTLKTNDWKKDRHSLAIFLIQLQTNIWIHIRVGESFEFLQLSTKSSASYILKSYGSQKSRFPD